MVDAADVIIIGVGPAGIATAIQLRRCHIQPVLLEQGGIGGLLRNSNLMENYPAFPDGINGLDLVALFEKQLRSAGVEVSFEKVLNLEYGDEMFFAEANRRVTTSAVVVIATGTKQGK